MRIAYPLEEEWEPEKSFVLYTVSKEVGMVLYIVVLSLVVLAQVLKRASCQCACFVCQRGEV